MATSARCSCQLPHLSLRLLQPEPHVHLTEHRSRDAQALLGLLPLSHSPIEPADTEVAAREERAQAQLLGQRLCALAIQGGGLEIRGALDGSDLTENLERPRLTRPLTDRHGQLERPVSRSLGLLRLSIEQESFRPREVEVRQECLDAHTFLKRHAPFDRATPVGGSP